LDSGDFSAKEFVRELRGIAEMHAEAFSLLAVEAEGTHARDLARRSRAHVGEIKELMRFAEFL